MLSPKNTTAHHSTGCIGVSDVNNAMKEDDQVKIQRRIKKIRHFQLLSPSCISIYNLLKYTYI